MGKWSFFVCQLEFFNYIPEDKDVIWERAPLMGLAKDGQLNAFKHVGFWHLIDTLKDKIELNDLWTKRKAPLEVWVD